MWIHHYFKTSNHSLGYVSWQYITESTSCFEGRTASWESIAICVLPAHFILAIVRHTGPLICHCMTIVMYHGQIAISKLNVDLLRKLLSSELLLEFRKTTNAGMLALFLEESVTVLKNYMIITGFSHCHADKT